ncbi:MULTISPECIES: hypothetical protein [Pseudonocardia]|uniref:hypothetical protein n=1 Tax=Pseudonocardia TaxID=1847 RepID=UPI001CF62ED6|nr:MULTISPECIES: hypothetical protein [unclassified Pseudonocardia]
MTTWTSDECAAHWGVQVGTWNSYVSRGQAPAPLPDPGPGGRKVWDADAVRAFSRPGVGRRRGSAESAAVLEELRAAADAPRERRRELLRAGREAGCEVSAMAAALGVSRHTAYAWLKD